MIKQTQLSFHRGIIKDEITPRDICGVSEGIWDKRGSNVEIHHLN